MAGGHAEKVTENTENCSVSAAIEPRYEYEATASKTLKHGETGADMRQPNRPFLTARQAAERLGVDERTVVDDVQEGMDGALPALIGGRYGEAWVVYAWQLEGERLETHRRRLTHADTSTAVMDSGR